MTNFLENGCKCSENGRKCCQVQRSFACVCTYKPKTCVVNTSFFPEVFLIILLAKQGPKAPLARRASQRAKRESAARRAKLPGVVYIYQLKQLPQIVSSLFRISQNTRDVVMYLDHQNLKQCYLQEWYHLPHFFIQRQTLPKVFAYLFQNLSKTCQIRQ